MPVGTFCSFFCDCKLGLDHGMSATTLSHCERMLQWMTLLDLQGGGALRPWLKCLSNMVAALFNEGHSYCCLNSLVLGDPKSF